LFSAKKPWVDKVAQASSLRAGWKPALPCRRLSQDFFALTVFCFCPPDQKASASLRLCGEKPLRLCGKMLCELLHLALSLCSIF
jgi:hypothetical protein